MQSTLGSVLAFQVHVWIHMHIHRTTKFLTFYLLIELFKVNLMGKNYVIIFVFLAPSVAPDI